MAYQRKRKVEVEMDTEAPRLEATDTDIEIPADLEFVEEVKQPDPVTAATEERSTTKTGKVFLTEEDKRLFKKFNQHIVKKLGLTANRSVKI